MYQEDIGWEQFLYCFFYSQWQCKHAEYKTSDLAKIVKTLTPELWAKQLIEICMATDEVCMGR